MPDFRDVYEWHQQADRRSRLVDPVLTVRQLGRFEALSRRPAGRADAALVLANANGSYQVFIPPHRPGRAELAAAGNQSLFEVDLGIHHLTFEERLPTSDDVGVFLAAIELTWRVTVPDLVIASGVRDVPTLLRPRIQQRLRPVSREYSADLTRDAERSAQQALDAGPLAEAEGLQIDCSVRLELDEAARAHKDRLRQYQYATEAHPHSLRHAREETELMAQKARFYQYYLTQEGVTAWALRLAEHPEDLPQALEFLAAGQKEQIANQLELVDKLLDRSHIEQYQLEETVRAGLETITRIFRGAGMPPADAPELDAVPEDRKLG